MSPASSKIALFIDGANLYATAKTLGFDIDYKRLLKEFQSRGTLLRAFYYTAIIEDQEYSSIRPLIDWLDYNGYTVVTKATKEFIDASGRRKVKGNMDIELAVDAMELAEHVDQIVLFSGDGDFRSLVEAVQRRGVRVTVISTISSQPPMIADELRRQADVFTDLVELQSKLGRDPSERPAPREPRHHAPQFVGNHRQLPRYRRNHRNADAATLDCFDKVAECSIAGEQNHLIDLTNHLHGIDGKFDVHVSLDLAAAAGVSELFHRLGDYSVAVVTEPIGQWAQRGILLILEGRLVVECPQQRPAALELHEKALVVDIEAQRLCGCIKIGTIDKERDLVGNG